MKVKVAAIALLFLMSASNTAFSQQINWNPIPIPGGSSPQINIPQQNFDNDNVYESNTGTRYRYDLNNPADRVRYNVDPAAQIMDGIKPNVQIDRSMGQYGGGAGD